MLRSNKRIQSDVNTIVNTTQTGPFGVSGLGCQGPGSYLGHNGKGVQMDLVWFLTGVGSALAVFWVILRLDTDPFEKRYQESQEWLEGQRRMAKALGKR